MSLKRRGCVLGIALGGIAVTAWFVLCPTTSLASSLSVSARRYVATSGSDTSRDCINFVTPCRPVQHVVDVAQSGNEIRSSQWNISGYNSTASI
jgi:hypothetical protein